MAAVPLRVLVAEDESLVARVIEEELRSFGAQVVGRASDGRQAVELTGSLAPDVVLMDVSMPELDGIEAAWEIQERFPTPVVVLTVYAGKEIADRAAAAGVGAYLVKPAGSQDLERAITIARARFADLVELRRLNAELREALASIKTLSGLLPICSACKRVRDDKGYWCQVESYIHAHAEVDFSHGICPECLPKLYPPEDYPELYEPVDEGPR